MRLTSSAHFMLSVITSVLLIQLLPSCAAILWQNPALPIAERKILIAIPPRMPVTVTDIKNLQGDHWVSELEIEIQNNSDKPIYYLSGNLTFPDIIDTEMDGLPRKLGTSFSYGRRELMNRGEFAAVGEAAIQPGQRHTLRLAPAQSEGLQHYLVRKNIEEAFTKKIYLRIDTLSFGDGTGYRAGAPYPQKQQ